MRETYWGYWLVLLGVFIIGVMLLVNNISTTNTQDYYNIKEVTQASMIDAVDFSYYRLYGNVKMSEQKFVENFVRRFAENLNMANTYDIDFYDIHEVPPKVSVKISTGSRSFNIANTRNDYDVVTTLNAILELGVQGEEGEGIKKVAEPCKMFIDLKLMKYFKGETVDGYSLFNDIKTFGGLTLTQEQQNSLKNVNSLKDFRTWFQNEFRIDGQLVKDFLKVESQNKYGALPNYMREWFKRGWMTSMS